MAALRRSRRTNSAIDTAASTTTTAAAAIDSGFSSSASQPSVSLSVAAMDQDAGIPLGFRGPFVGFSSSELDTSSTSDFYSSIAATSERNSKMVEEEDKEEEQMELEEFPQERRRRKRIIRESDDEVELQQHEDEKEVGEVKQSVLPPAKKKKEDKKEDDSKYELIESSEESDQDEIHLPYYIYKQSIVSLINKIKEERQKHMSIFKGIMKDFKTVPGFEEGTWISRIKNKSTKHRWLNTFMEHKKSELLLRELNTELQQLEEEELQEDNLNQNKNVETRGEDKVIEENYSTMNIEEKKEEKRGKEVSMVQIKTPSNLPQWNESANVHSSHDFMELFQFSMVGTNISK